MEEYISDRETKYRKLKQEFLIKSIIEEDYDANKFTEYIAEKRYNGEDIDNWTLDELETEVEMFKYQLEEKNPHLALKHLLDDIELVDSDNKLYVNSIKTIKKPPTSTGKANTEVNIESIQIKEGGILTGKFLVYNIYTIPSKIKVIRTDTEFKWLYDTIKREIPFCTPPPLICHPSRSFNKEQIDLSKFYYQKFLSELVANRTFKNSKALEIFLTAQTKEEMALKYKELESYISKYVPIDRGLTKKKIDSLTEDPLLNTPTTEGKIDVKLSPLINTHLSVLSTQLNAYEQIFEKIERTAIEIDKHYSRLSELNLEVSQLYSEFQQLVKAGHDIKNTIESVSEIEDNVYSAISTHFNNQCNFISNYIRRPKKVL